MKDTLPNVPPREGSLAHVIWQTFSPHIYVPPRLVRKILADRKIFLDYHLLSGTISRLAEKGHIEKAPPDVYSGLPLKTYHRRPPIEWRRCDR